MNRRNWLRTAGGLLVAPAVVRAESLMQIRPPLVIAAPTWIAMPLQELQDFPSLSEAVLRTDYSFHELIVQVLVDTKAVEKLMANVSSNNVFLGQLLK